MRRWGLGLAFLAGCAFDVPADLEWLTPDDADTAPIGDPIELAVAASDPDVAVVHFAIDGVKVGACDPAQPDEDCRRDGVWRWTVVFRDVGAHTLTATITDAGGDTVGELTRAITVVRELPPDALEDAPEDGVLDSEPDEPAEAISTLLANRGSLDPDRAFHSIFGGISWRVFRQRVRLHSGIPMGSVSAVNQCMRRFGPSIRRWADHFHLSRASIIATALTESNCTNPAGSSDGLSSGPMQVTASTCSAITGLSRTTCRVRMHTHPDFSFKVGATYINSSFQRKQHHRDPPKIAAAYNAGSLRRSSANRWHMLTTGNHIDRFVRHYNAYRIWESQQ